MYILIKKQNLEIAIIKSKFLLKKYLNQIILNKLSCKFIKINTLITNPYFLKVLIFNTKS